MNIRFIKKENTMGKLFKGLVVSALVTIMSLGTSGIANAWDPADYTGNGQPQFNVYRDVDGMDERDFLTVGIDGTNTSTFTNNLELCEGKARFTVYIHNGAPEEFNGTNNDGTGVARDTRLKIDLEQGRSKAFDAEATVSASNANSVADGAKITCNGQEVELSYDDGSATIFSQKRGEDGLSDDVIGSAVGIGTFDDGFFIPGCWDTRVYVSFTATVKKVELPPETPPETPPQTPPTTPTPTPTPPSGQLPRTGVGSVLGAVLGTGALGTTISNWLRSRKALKAALLKG